MVPSLMMENIWNLNLLIVKENIINLFKIMEVMCINKKDVYRGSKIASINVFYLNNENIFDIKEFNISTIIFIT